MDPRLKNKADVAIIGGGVIGICTAYYLWKKGIQAVVLEKGEVGHGCSFANAGYVSPSHFRPLASPGILAKGLKWILNPESPFYIKPRLDRELISWLWKFRAACGKKRSMRSMPVLRDLNLASAGLFKELSNVDGLDFGFKTNGLFMLYNSPAGERHELDTAALAERVGVQARAMSTRQINELDPGICTHARGGVFYPQNCHMDPARFVQGLATLIEKEGVKIHSSTGVVGFLRTGDRISALKTTRGDFVADEYVLAGGSWSPAIVRETGINVPMQPAKGYSVTVLNPPRTMSIPSILSEAKVAVTPLGTALRFGGTLELAGFDLSVNVRRVRAILNAVPRYFTDLDTREYMNIEPWAGLRPCSPDGLPFIGRFKRVPNLIAATGHAMLGLSLAPITGKLVAELISHTTPSLDLYPLRADRFA
jgi:D-amino-acid dehydrogenase